MTRDEARATVLEAIQRIVPDADFTDLGPNEKLRDRYELDSLDFMSFVEMLSVRSGLPIPEDDYDRLATLASCTGYLSTAGASSTA